jgi:hypothetical protein
VSLQDRARDDVADHHHSGGEVSLCNARMSVCKYGCTM